MNALPELLAPAGTIEAGLTAFDAGADAVYAGLSRFNARERGKNFTLDGLSKLLAHGHKIGRRVYVTLNTLIKERELGEVAELLAELAVIRPDGIIVQDLGVVRLIRERFPELEVHGSTQMAIHNSAGLAVAEQLGLSRVILERQTTLEEIRAMGARSAVELEVFVHGALCCSRSGVCLFSSWMGGWSGNRGKCKQPCRRRYHSEEGNGFFFSPSDLYALEDLPALAELGVTSLKIEGRLRKPDYVRRVVTAYRMALDAGDEERGPVLKEARAELSGALGRRWHGAFRGSSDFDDVIRHESLGASGLLCGTVIGSGGGGVEIEVSRPLHRYDTIRIQPRSGDEGPALTITTLRVGRKKVPRAHKGQTCWVPCGEAVPRGALVFKTGSATADLAERVESLPLARPAVDLVVTLGEGRLRIEAAQAGEPWQAEVDLQPARSRPIDGAAVAEQLRKTSSDHLAAGRIDVSVEPGVFLPPKVLKGLRRDFWKWAEGAVDGRAVRGYWQERVKGASEGRDAEVDRAEEGGERVVFVPSGGEEPAGGARVARSLEEARRGDEALLPDFCPESELEAIEGKIDRAVRSGVRRFRVTSLFGLALLRGREGLDLTTSFPLPACNGLAVEELRRLGANRVQAWVELETTALDELRQAVSGPLEMMTYGRLAVLSTRMAVPARGRVTDARGAGFRIVRADGLTNLYPDRPLSVEARPGYGAFVDLTHAEPDEQETSDLNTRRELV